VNFICSRYCLDPDPPPCRKYDPIASIFGDPKEKVARSYRVGYATVDKMGNAASPWRYDVGAYVTPP